MQVAPGSSNDCGCRVLALWVLGALLCAEDYRCWGIAYLLSHTLMNMYLY